MKKRMLSWGLVLSLFLTLLPVPALAAEDNTLSGDGQLAAAAAQCSCGAQPDEAGVVTHAEGCPLAVQEDVTPGTAEERKEYPFGYPIRRLFSGRVRQPSRLSSPKTRAFLRRRTPYPIPLPWS